MSRSACPLPQVEEALAPYIHTRQETLRIRQALTKHLRDQLQDEGGLTHFSLVAPSSSLEADDAASIPDGLYSQYLEALNAHRKAREQYYTLKAEIQGLQQTDQDERDNVSSDGSIGDHIKLLRQRQQYRKLEIIQDALTQLEETVPNATRIDPKALLKEKLGEPPQPPNVPTEQNDGDGKIDELVFRLKRELLTAQSHFDHVNATKAEADARTKSLPEPSPAAQIAALRAARDELITWIEGELAKIPEDENEGDVSDSVPEHFSPNDSHAVAESMKLTDEEIAAQVYSSYERYIEVRRMLIQQVEATSSQVSSLQTIAPEEPYSRPGTSPAKDTTGNSSQVQALDILPYLPVLIASSRTESALLQQSAHLRRQLVLASEETSRAIQRLAGESYLVSPSATSMEAWAKAADDAAAKVKGFIEEQVRVGDECVERAREGLQRMAERKVASEKLRGDL